MAVVLHPDDAVIRIHTQPIVMVAITLRSDAVIKVRNHDLW